MSTLYRKYRPQKFSEVAGQIHIKQVLQNEIKANKIAHAFLFSGSRGIGKTTIARILAKSINCEKRKDGEFEPCNNCDACLEITESKSLDVVEMDAATHTQVDKVRENIIENINFAPANKRYKVFIIDEVHMLSISAFNALLKTLEEPPAHAIFVLATTEIHKIPETIISRCQRFDFQKIGFDDIITRLKILAEKENIEIEDEVFTSIARNAEGGLRDAEGLLGQVFSIFDGKNKITAEEASVVLPKNNFNLVRDFVLLISKKQTPEALRFIFSLSNNGIDTKRFIDEIIEYLRGILSFKYLGNDDVGSNINIENDKEILNNLTAERTVELIEILLKRKETIIYSKIDELPLELAVIEMCEPTHNFQAPKALLEEEVKKNSPVSVIEESQNIVFVKKEEEPASVSSSHGLSEGSKVETSSTKEEKPKEEIKKTIGPVSFSIDKVRKNWHSILNKANDYNPSLPVVLNMGVPLKIEDGVVKIAFQYPLYKDKFNKIENIDSICKIFNEVLKEEAKLEGVLLENGELEEAKKMLPKEPKNNNIEKEASVMSVDKIAEAFGGKIVE